MDSRQRSRKRDVVRHWRTTSIFSKMVGFWIVRCIDWHIVTNATKEFTAPVFRAKKSKNSFLTWRSVLRALGQQTKAIRYFENSVGTRKSTDHNIPEYRSENLKTHNVLSDYDTGTDDKASDYKSPRIALSMKLTWNELTSKSGLPLVTPTVSKPQTQHCELPLWSSHSIRVWIECQSRSSSLKMCADNKFCKIGSMINTHTQTYIYATVSLCALILRMRERVPKHRLENMTGRFWITYEN